MTTKTVLIVDDSNTVRQQIRMALSTAGFEVVEAFDGQDGLEKVRSTQPISMIICDVNMPRMNGIEMIKAIASEQLRPEVPIIMLTTEGNPALIREAKTAGARGWIVKPFNPTMLISAVQKLAA